MNLRLGLLVGTLLLGTGCAGLRTRATCPSEGGKPWREVKSTHFRVLTDLDAEAAQQTALELEKFRRALLLAWDSDFDPPGEVEAIILRNAGEFEEFSEGRIGGFATVGTDGPLLVMSGHGYLVSEQPGDQRTQAHELAHYLSRYVLLRQPRWFAEGLATYLETLTFKGGAAEVVLGRPHGWNLGYVREHGWLTLEELWQWKFIDGMGQAEMQRHYASAWLWVHYLMNEHVDRFVDFQSRLARAEEPRQAFEAAFRGVPDLAGGLRTYVNTGRYAVLTIPLPAVPTKVEVRELDGAEVHAIRARLRLITPGSSTPEQRKQQAEVDLAQALREDPANVSATVLHSELSAAPTERLPLARALTQARPQSGPAWLLLARAIGESPGGSGEEQLRALTRAVELQPQSATALNTLAWYYANARMPQKAFELAKHAAELAPGDGAVLDTYAAVLFQIGKCPDALRLQRRALDVLDEYTSDSLHKSIQATLEKYERSCGAPEAR